MSEKKSYFEGKKILAVDDEKDILGIIEEELEMADVDIALDYQTASEKIKQNKYDLEPRTGFSPVKPFERVEGYCREQAP